jgi:hypothetical protein
MMRNIPKPRMVPHVTWHPAHASGIHRPLIAAPIIFIIAIIAIIAAAIYFLAK